LPTTGKKGAPKTIFLVDLLEARNYAKLAKSKYNAK
jgi:hypothetical protein